MMYVLDTNVVSEFARQRPDAALLGWLDTLPHGSIAIPFSVVMEIQRGITELVAAEPSKASRLQKWLDGILGSDITFLPMDVATARLLGAMSAERSLRDLWVPDRTASRPKMKQDLSIAATAISYRLPLATRNIADFLRIDAIYPLPGLFNPFAVSWVISPR